MIEIKEKKDCCGCAACANICPQSCVTMQEDAEGFCYPVIDIEVCINCGLCEKVCPVINVKKEQPFEQEGYVVQAKDSQVLRESTAGGAFSVLAKRILKEGGVVFGVEMLTPQMACHTYIENERELTRYRGSKYIQSYIDESVYKQTKNFLQQGRKVLFSGTPCQIEGLVCFLGKTYEDLITVDVVCRAVPSPKIFRKYIEYHEKHMKKRIKRAKFRDKYYGYKYATMNLTTEDDKSDYHRGRESDIWYRAFFSNICDRPACYECKFKKRYRVSDFTIWDCFPIWRFSKELNNDKGATRVLIHSEKGKALWKQVEGDFFWEKINSDLLVKDSKEMLEVVQKNESRERFFVDAELLSVDDLFSKYFPVSWKVKVERLIRVVCYKLGIYSLVKKIVVKVLKKY